MKYDICCIGHITKDKIVTPGQTSYLAGGTAFYFSHAISRMPVSYCLVTALAPKEMRVTDQMREKGVHIKALESLQTVYFENIYAENQDHRKQRVLQQADPFTWSVLTDVDACLFHLGPLLADDFEPGLIAQIAQKGIVSLDVQGLLRNVENHEVLPVQWKEKRELLPYIHTLKANDMELEVLTGESDMRHGAKVLANLGVAEVVITLGSKGSLVYADGVFYEIPAYKPPVIVDATGCGDTYMAGYLSRRYMGDQVPAAANFASAMAGLKIATAGPFKGSEADVFSFLAQAGNN